MLATWQSELMRPAPTSVASCALRRRCGRRGLQRPAAEPAAAGLLEAVEGNGGDQDRARHDLLPEALDPRDREAVLQGADEEDTDRRARDAADPADEARAAEEDRCGGVQRDVLPDEGAG